MLEMVVIAVEPAMVAGRGTAKPEIMRSTSLIRKLAEKNICSKNMKFRVEMIGTCNTHWLKTARTVLMKTVRKQAITKADN